MTPRKRPVSNALPLSVALLLTAGGCAQCFPEQAAMGVARLTVRNVGAIATLVNNDSRCGFASQAVLDAAATDGAPGASGTVTYTVKGCEIALKDDQEISRDCKDVVTSGSGKVTVSATRTVSGRLTGHPDTPVIPEGPESVLIHISEARFDGLNVKVAGNDNHLTMVSGTVSAKVAPRLAVSAETGFCAVARASARLSAIAYKDAQLAVVSPSASFDVDVASSELEAQVGQGGGQENALAGTITVWGQAVEVPTAGDSDGLDPEYDAAKFLEAEACRDDLTSPAREDCDPDAILGLNAARLLARSLGVAASILDGDETCGFASAEVEANVAVDGAVGQDSAEATYGVIRPCRIEMSDPRVVSEDCYGVQTLARGVIDATGIKTVRGFATGAAETPVVPTSWEPAALALTLSASDFEVWTSDGGPTLVLRDGLLEGTVVPRMAQDMENGACAKSIPVVRFEGVSFGGALELQSDGYTFGLSFDSSDLDAQNGAGVESENSLAGDFVIAGETKAIAAETPLDPDYDMVDFESGYICTPGQRIAQDEAQCSFRAPLSQLSAHELIYDLQAIAALLERDDTCGFAAPAVLADPVALRGEVGATGSVQHRVAGCSLHFDTPVVVDRDCHDLETRASGQLTATVTREVVGRRAEDPLVIAEAPDAVTYRFEQLALSDFATERRDAAGELDGARLQITGSLTATVRPLNAQRADTQGNASGVYDVATPAAFLDDVVLSQSSARIELEGMHFDFQLDSAELRAMRGAYLQDYNFMYGLVVADGQEVEIPVDRRDPSLDKDLDLAAWDESYACTEGLYEVLPHE